MTGLDVHEANMLLAENCSWLEARDDNYVDGMYNFDQGLVLGTSCSG